ncbi:hypothetical protein NKR19_g3693 [Coniochaeta hoffmannii]|uniref:Uncharacterized protein n=1 Tax=Coniochaeta hoffmannii TaxID=91930 RepID=A0AA38RTX2_9PEZI|nr:hypothetical protein NKR19_g3693 [Coniochaeta hoffmannii]
MAESKDNKQYKYRQEIQQPAISTDEGGEDGMDDQDDERGRSRQDPQRGRASLRSAADQYGQAKQRSQVNHRTRMGFDNIAAAQPLPADAPSMEQSDRINYQPHHRHLNERSSINPRRIVTAEPTQNRVPPVPLESVSFQSRIAATNARDAYQNEALLRENITGSIPLAEAWDEG